jgi:hypothetical protein
VRGIDRRSLLLLSAVVVLGLVGAAFVFLRADDAPPPDLSDPPPPPVLHEIPTSVELHRPSGDLISGQPFTVEGSIDSAVERPVRLQVRRGDRFVTIARTRVEAGEFLFTDVRLGGGTHVLRAVAPAVRDDGGDTPTLWQQARSRPVRNLAVQQVTVSATALPPVAQPGKTVAEAPEGATVSAEFTPATPGSVARLQRRTASGWQNAGRTQQDRAGWAVFTAPAGATYRITGDRPKLPGGPASDPVTATAWRVDFADDFSGTSLDWGRWLQESSGYTPTGQRTCSAADASALRVEGGRLRMGVRVNPARAGQTCSYEIPGKRVGQHPYMFNTQINTRGKYVFRHGVAAARMKLQRSRGMHSAFWLLPENWELPAGNPAGGTEIDIVEWFGHNPSPLARSISAYIHYTAADGQRVKLGDPDESGYRTYVDLLRDQNDEWWDTYHVFSVEWTPSVYVFRVDGKEFYREPRAIMQTPAYVSLSMLIGDYELKNLTPDSHSDAADVDWVRIYQR